MKCTAFIKEDGTGEYTATQPLTRPGSDTVVARLGCIWGDKSIDNALESKVLTPGEAWAWVADRGYAPVAVGDI